MKQAEQINIDSFHASKIQSRRNFPIVFMASSGFLCVLSAYIFLISAGTWRNWIATTTHYDQLAESFRAGKLWLEEKPAPALLALPNPYDPKARAGIPYPQDVSLYKGKFYLYFGPVPALILMFIKPFASTGIGDQYLVFGFMFGILLFQTMLVVKTWRHFLSDAPAWLLLPSVLFMGLISPFGWMLSLASVYNAAILGGQFFFLAGFFAAFSAFDQPPVSKLKLALAGFFWVCAIGSRITQVIPVGFMGVMVLIWLLVNHRKPSLYQSSLRALLSLGLPMLIGAIGLGWYNWARFDSIFESGVTYQLAGVNLQKHQQELFSHRYIANNIYNYFLIKPGIDNKFPFLGPIQGYNKPVIKGSDLPDMYFSQETAGLLYIAPFILFSIVSATSMLKIFPKDSTPANQEEFPFKWIIISLFGSFLSSLLFFLFFFWAGVRYLADFMPAFAMLSVFGFVQAYLYTIKHPFLRLLLVILGLILIVITIINSNLIAMSISSAKYREFNPELWKQLTKFFNRLFIEQW